MRFSLALLAVTVFLSINCTQEPAEETRPLYREPQAGEILILYLSGESELQYANRSSIPYAGEWINGPAEIQTGMTGTCILQDGNRNLYYLREDTHLSLSSLENNTLLHLHQGTIEVDAKIPILLSTEEFLLNLQQGLLSLKIDHQDTRIAVYSGSARLLPGNLSPADFDKLFEERWPLLAKDSRKVPFQLSSDKEYTWPHRQYRDFSRDINTIEFEGENGLKNQETIAQLLHSLMERNRPEGVLLNQELFLVQAAPFLDSLLEKEELQYCRIQADPPEAHLRFGPLSGKEFLELPLPTKGDYTFHADLRGFNSKSLIMNPENIDSSNTIVLQQKASQNYLIRTLPAEARIYINDRFAGKGGLALTQKPGDIITIRVELEEYNSREITLDELGVFPENLEIKLNKTVEGAFFVSYEDPIGFSYLNDSFIVADRKGNLTSVLAKRGLRPWGYATANSPNDWSSPVICFDQVYFSGKRTLTVFSPKKREVTGIYSLNGRSMHQYGRRVTSFENKIVLPTDDTIILLSPDLKNTLKVINIPGGSLMTPLSYESFLYSVSNDGRIHKIDSAGNVVQSGFSSAFTPLGMSIATSGGKGFFSDRKGLIVCFNLETLEILWENSIPDEGKLVFRDLMPDGDSIYLYSDGYVYRFHKDKGDFQETLPFHFETPPLIDQGILYGAVDREHLMILNLDDRLSKNVISLQAPPTSPVYVSHGMVVIGMNNGRILIINQTENNLTSP